MKKGKAPTVSLQSGLNLSYIIITTIIYGSFAAITSLP